jgi:uncharacterized membrane protein
VKNLFGFYLIYPLANMKLWKFKTIFNNQAKPLPFKFYFLPIFLITLIGLADAIYLSISHYRVYMDMGYQSFCAISQALNCDTVSQSLYSILFNVPVPVWGVFGYAFFLILLTFAWPKMCFAQTGLDLTAFDLSGIYRLQPCSGGNFHIPDSQLLHHVHSQLCGESSFALFHLDNPYKISMRVDFKGDSFGYSLSA